MTTCPDCYGSGVDSHRRELCPTCKGRSQPEDGSEPLDEMRRRLPMTPPLRHDAYAKPAHLAYGNHYDPHAAVCACGWQGLIRMTRGRAEADADEHNQERPA